MKVIRFVKSLSWVLASQLEGMHVIGPDKCVLPVGVTFSPICISGHPEMIVKEEMKDNIRMFNTSLTFISPDFVRPGEGPVALKVVDEKERSWVIGTSEAPFPVIMETSQRPSQPTQQSCPIFNLEWQSESGPLKMLL